MFVTLIYVNLVLCLTILQGINYDMNIDVNQIFSCNCDSNIPGYVMYLYYSIFGNENICVYSHLERT